jgi:ribosomal subunit interface protein
MKINYLQKHLSLTDGQKEYIETKLDHLKKFDRVEDESTLVKVDVEYTESKISDRKILMIVQMVLPHMVARAEVDCKTVEEGIDLAHDKLKIQLEKHKEKSQQ